MHIPKTRAIVTILLALAIASVTGTAFASETDAAVIEWPGHYLTDPLPRPEFSNPISDVTELENGIRITWDAVDEKEFANYVMAVYNAGFRLDIVEMKGLTSYTLEAQSSSEVAAIWGERKVLIDCRRMPANEHGLSGPRLQILVTAL